MSQIMCFLFKSSKLSSGKKNPIRYQNQACWGKSCGTRVMKWKAVLYEVAICNVYRVGLLACYSAAPLQYAQSWHKTICCQPQCFPCEHCSCSKSLWPITFAAMTDPAQAKCYLLSSRTFKSSSSRLVNFIQDFISSSQYRIRPSGGTVPASCLMGITT